MLIQRFKIEAKDGSFSWSVVANSADSAWQKFCRQRFGVLKPCRGDYRVSLMKGES